MSFKCFFVFYASNVQAQRLTMLWLHRPHINQHFQVNKVTILAGSRTPKPKQKKQYKNLWTQKISYASNCIASKKTQTKGCLSRSRSRIRGKHSTEIKLLFCYEQNTQALPLGISQGRVPRIWANSVTTNILNYYKSWHQQNEDAETTEILEVERWSSKLSDAICMVQCNITGSYIIADNMILLSVSTHGIEVF
jgi:hypothetical protein